MNPVDNNLGLRPPRVDGEQGARRAEESRRPAPSPQGPAPSDESASRGESVSLTQTASDLLQLEAQLRELPSVDQQRVDAIRQAIEDGSYDINPGAIVDQLLQSERERG